jgi:hypothetical protein
LQLPPHPASAICPRRAAPQSVGRPARPRRTRPQPYAPNRSPPETHRQAGCGARASRPRRPSFEAERRRAGGGRSPLRPSVRVVHHSRSVPVECRQSSAAHEGFGERSRWGAVSTPRYRSALSNNRRADPAVVQPLDRSARRFRARVRAGRVLSPRFRHPQVPTHPGPAGRPRGCVRSPRRPSGRSSRRPASIPPRDSPGRPGDSEPFSNPLTARLSKCGVGSPE